MAFGALVKNTAGNILVSSDVTCVHRVGRATFESTYLSGLTNFPGYAGDDTQITLSGRHLHRYSITAPSAPLFFIRPVNYDNFHGVLNQYQSGGKWYVDIIQSGLIAQAPEVYAFSTPSNSFVTDESYGFMTRLANGNIAFDSRQRPLAVYAAESVIPPEIPCDGGQPYTSGGYAWNDNTLDWDFTSDDTYNTYDMPSIVDKENLMFSAPSVAQAVYSRQKNGYKFSRGYRSGQDHYSAANWWAMYHQQYKLASNAIHAGWGPYAAGYSFSSTWDSGGWFDGGGGSIVTGTRPFSDATINWTNNVIIVADARPYL
jgi:hypothetical protein